MAVEAMPNNLKEHDVLMKAKRFYRKFKFIELDVEEKPNNNKEKKNKFSHMISINEEFVGDIYFLSHEGQ